MSPRTFSVGYLRIPKPQNPLLVLSVCALIAQMPNQAEAQLCPSISTVANNCYNGVCEPFDGENASNCPEDCADENTTMVGYYGQTYRCPRTNIYRPTTAADAQRAMRQIVSSGRRVHFTGEGHSNTDIACSDGDIISTENMRGIDANVTTFEGVPTMRIEAGVSFNALQSAANGLGYSLGMNVPGYGRIHVIGGDATGLHGSSPTGNASISRRIVALEVMNQAGTITTYTRGTTGVSDPELWQSLNTSLGLLGMIVAARVEVEPQFALDTQISRIPGNDFFANPGGYLNHCDFAFTNWFPETDMVMITCGVRVPAAQADPTAWNGLFTPDLDSFFQGLAVPTFQLAFCDENLNRINESLRYSQTADWLYRTVNGVEVPTDRVVGLSHRITTLPNFREGQPSFSQVDWEAAIPESRLAQTLAIIRQSMNDANYALPLIGVVIRFDRASNDTILGGNAVRPGVTAGERIVHIEIPTYVAYEATQAQIDDYHAPVIDVIQELIGTVPEAHFHWGKNDEWVFADSQYRVNTASRRARFQAVIDRVDPYGVFSNTWSRRNGFTAPQYGQPFANVYFPTCASNGGDTDGDGIRNCTETILGSSPTTANGMYVRIANFYWGGLDTGSCNNYDNWSELTSYGQFGNNFLGWNYLREKRTVYDGWQFETPSHDYRNASYNFNPSLTSSGANNWAAMFSANMAVPQTGVYCFGSDNGSGGTDIIEGWNSCSQIWVNKTRRTEVGMDASPRTPTSCVSLTAGTHRIDIVSRHHDANLIRSFIEKPRWCVTASGTCTPNREFEQYMLTPVTSL